MKYQYSLQLYVDLIFLQFWRNNGIINPIQDGPSRGYSRIGEGLQKDPFP